MVVFLSVSKRKVSPVAIALPPFSWLNQDTIPVPFAVKIAFELAQIVVSLAIGAGGGGQTVNKRDS